MKSITTKNNSIKGSFCKMHCYEDTKPRSLTKTMIYSKLILAKLSVLAPLCLPAARRGSAFFLSHISDFFVIIRGSKFKYFEPFFITHFPYIDLHWSAKSRFGKQCLLSGDKNCYLPLYAHSMACNTNFR